MAKAQFNPSTLKASYNPVTRKQQVYDPSCNFCIETPIDLKVTLAGQSTCCLKRPNDLPKEPWPRGSWDGIINGTFILKYYRPCQWRLDVPISAKLRIWTTVDGECDVGPYYEYTFETLTLLLLLTSSTAQFRMSVGPTPPGAYVAYFKSPIYSTPINCFDNLTVWEDQLLCTNNIGYGEGGSLSVLAPSGIG